jgi:hypothetical protein
MREVAAQFTDTDADFFGVECLNIHGSAPPLRLCSHKVYTHQSYQASSSYFSASTLISSSPAR